MQHTPVWWTERPRWASRVAIDARSLSRSPWSPWLHHTLLTCVRDWEAQVICPTSTCSHWCKVTVKVILVTMFTPYTAHLCQGLGGPGQLSHLHLQPLVQGHSQGHTGYYGYTIQCSPVWGTWRPRSAVRPPLAATGARSQSRSSGRAPRMRQTGGCRGQRGRGRWPPNGRTHGSYTQEAPLGTGLQRTVQ